MSDENDELKTLREQYDRLDKRRTRLVTRCQRVQQDLMDLHRDMAELKLSIDSHAVKPSAMPGMEQ